MSDTTAADPACSDANAPRADQQRRADNDRTVSVGLLIALAALVGTRLLADVAIGGATGNAVGWVAGIVASFVAGVGTMALLSRSNR